MHGEGTAGVGFVGAVGAQGWHLIEAAFESSLGVLGAFEVVFIKVLLHQSPFKYKTFDEHRHFEGTCLGIQHTSACFVYGLDFLWRVVGGGIKADLPAARKNLLSLCGIG